MHIGFLIMNISNKGGTERVTTIIANELHKIGYKVSILSCQNGEESFFTLSSEIRCISLCGQNHRNTVSRKVAVASKLETVVEQEKIDIVIAVDVALYLYLLPLQIKKKCKCVAWEHFNYYISKGRIVKIARYMAAKYADCVIVLGKNDLNNYREHYKKIRRIDYIYNPIAVRNDTLANVEVKRVVAAGRLDEQKGFDMLVDIWNIVEKKIPDWTLDVFGEGELREELEKKISDYRLTRISLRGYSEDIEKEYNNSSIFVLTSRYEGFVLVLMEAMSKGIPCVSFRCKEGPEEIIRNGENGYLVEAGNITEFADRLIELMNDEELRRMFSSNSRVDIDRFEIGSIMEKWNEIITSL